MGRVEAIGELKRITAEVHWDQEMSAHPGQHRIHQVSARSVMRRPPQLGQKPRPLHENGTSRSKAQVPQRTRAKPWARTDLGV